MTLAADDNVLVHGVWRSRRVVCDDRSCTRQHFERNVTPYSTLVFYNDGGEQAELDFVEPPAVQEAVDDVPAEVAEISVRFHYEDLPRHGRPGIVVELEPNDRVAVRMQDGTVLSCDLADVERTDG